MKKIFTSCLLLCGMHAFAQPAIQWQKKYGSTYADHATCIDQTADGGFIVGGITNGDDSDVVGFHDTNPGTGEYDMWVVKLNAAGNIQWKKALGGYGDDEQAAVHPTADGGYIVAGNSNFSSTIPYSMIIKLNDTGGIVWQKHYGGSASQVAKAIQQTADGGYIMAGYTSSNDGDVSGNHGGNDAWVVKINDTGKILWQKCYGGTNSEMANDIKLTSDGGYIVAGSAQSNDGDVTDHHGTSCASFGYCEDFWVLKLNNTGTVQWKKSFGGTDDDQAFSVLQSADGGYVVAGSTKSADGDVTGTHPGPVVNTADYWIVKLNSSGVLQWQKTLGGNSDDIPYGIVQAADGGYMAAGITPSSNGDVAGNHGGFDGWLVKVSSTGSLVWQRPYGGTGYEAFYAMQLCTDGGVVMAGYAGDVTDGDLAGDHAYGGYWIVRLAATTDVPQVNSRTSVTFSPNPTHGTITMQVIGAIANASYTITDMAGRALLTGSYNAGNTEIDLSKLATGMYLLRAENSSFKIVKE